MGRFILAPEKFKSLEADAKHSDKIKSIRSTGEYSGIIETKDVTVDYNYDPSMQSLNYNIGKKHSLAARIAGDNIIEQHITDVIFNLENAPAPTSGNLAQGGQLSAQNTGFVAPTTQRLVPKTPTPIPNPAPKPAEPFKLTNEPGTDNSNPENKDKGENNGGTIS